MKKAILFIFLIPFISISQICNPNGNIVIFSNYDGGVLNIDVDVNIPNLKIGVVSYEGTTINISGTYAANVVAVEYAGYNASNAHCGSVINTSINGAGSATTNIVLTPTSTLANTNGYTSIICAYSCDNNSSQGGCNTVDQVEDYFITLFGGTLYSHDTQYGCWSGNQLVSTSGNCCPAAALSSSQSNTDATCADSCDATASVTAAGGTAPYTYSWGTAGFSTSSVTDLCAGTYTVTITDAIGATVIEMISITQPTALNASFSGVIDAGDCSGEITVAVAGGTPAYTYLWDTQGGSGTSATATGLCAGNPCVTVTDQNNCIVEFCDTVHSSLGVFDNDINLYAKIYPNPSNGNAKLIITSENEQKANLIVYDSQGREVKNETIKLFEGENTFHLSIDAKGVYLLSVSIKDGEIKQRFVVE